MSLGLLLVVALTVSPVSEAQTGQLMPGEPITPSFTRVRSMDRYVFALIRKGYEGSPTFRELVDALQRSNVIVLVQPGVCAGGRIRSCLVSVNGSEQERHIRIKVDPQHTIEIGLIATVAHELQHAAEIAERPDIVDAAGVMTLYRRIAFGRCQQGLSEECETSRALVTERTVLRELGFAKRFTPAVPPRARAVGTAEFYRSQSSAARAEIPPTVVVCTQPDARGRTAEAPSPVRA